MPIFAIYLQRLKVIVNEMMRHRTGVAKRLKVMRKFLVKVAKSYVVAMTKALPYPYINTPHNM